jgi:hypothetical protein
MVLNVEGLICSPCRRLVAGRLQRTYGGAADGVNSSCASELGEIQNQGHAGLGQGGGVDEETT